MKTYSPRASDSPVVASCRFDKDGHPPPSTHFAVCSMYDGERLHLHLESMDYPRVGEVVSHGKTDCNGYECKRWIMVRHKVSLKAVQA